VRCDLSAPDARCPVCGFQARRRDGRLVVGAIRSCPGSPPPCGPGCHLKKLLAWAFIRPTGKCRCNERARLMDLQGPDWCEANADTIVGWMQEEAENRGMPFSGVAARATLALAISAARAEAGG